VISLPDRISCTACHPRHRGPHRPRRQLPGSYDDYVYRVQNEIDQRPPRRPHRASPGKQIPPSGPLRRVASRPDAPTALSKKLKPWSAKSPKPRRRKRNVSPPTPSSRHETPSQRLQAQTGESHRRIGTLEEQWLALSEDLDGVYASIAAFPRFLVRRCNGCLGRRMKGTKEANAKTAHEYEIGTRLCTHPLSHLFSHPIRQIAS